ncbi:MAG: hypothetical protein WAL10_01635, partial [Acetobacteraceae bacterium]
MRLLPLAALCLLLLLSRYAWADDIGPDQAQALQQQLKDWLAGLLGPAVKQPELGLRVTGEHDHYVVTWPIPGLAGASGQAAATANLRPLDGGRWSVDEMKVPPSGNFTMTVPETGEAGKGTPVNVQFSVGRQDTHGVIDPGLTTASKLHTEMGDLVATSDSAKQHQEQRLDRYLADTVLSPAQDGRLNLSMDALGSGWKSATQINGGTPMAIGIQTMRAVGQVNGVNRDRFGELLAATSGLIGALPPDIATKSERLDLPAPVRAQLRLMI